MEVPVNVDEGDEDAEEGEDAATDDALVLGANSGSGDSTAFVALTDSSVAALVAHPAAPASSSSSAATASATGDLFALESSALEGGSKEEKDELKRIDKQAAAGADAVAGVAWNNATSVAGRVVIHTCCGAS
jgi:hypothetical protein